MDWEDKVRAAINATGAIQDNGHQPPGTLIYVFMGGLFSIQRFGNNARILVFYPQTTYTANEMIQFINTL